MLSIEFRNLKTLDQGSKGKKIIIKSVKDGPYKDKLHEMGFIPNQELRLLRKAPFGDPIAIMVGDGMVMLRISEAQGIEIEEIDS